MRSIFGVVKNVIKAALNIIELPVVYMPNPLGNKLRYLYYRGKFKRCGKNVVIDVGVLFSGVRNISIGDNVHIDKYCVISAESPPSGDIRRKNVDNSVIKEGELFIGDNVHICQFCLITAYGGVHLGNNCVTSVNVKIYSMSSLAYDPDDRENHIKIFPYDKAPLLLGPVVLEDNVWIGLNAAIMPGTHVGRDSFVVSNSLVMDKFEENSYIMGQPAKRIKQRFSKKEKE